MGVMAAEVVGSVLGVIPVGELGGVPVPVVRSLRLLAKVERERAVRSRRWSDARDCDLVTGQEALAVIEAAEVVKAWADSVSLVATGRVVEVLDHEDDLHCAPRVGARDRGELADAAVSEIAAATGLGERETSRRVAMATAEPDRLEPLVHAMRTRGVSWFRAVTVLEGTAGIETEDLPQVYATVLADRRDGSPPSPAQVRDRIRRQVLAHDPGCGERARTSALRERTAWVRPHPEGTATLAATGDAARCTAAFERVDTIARTLKAAGYGTVPTAAADPIGSEAERTLAQLRSDVLIDLVLYGQVIAPTPLHVPSADAPAADAAGGGAAQAGARVPVGACDLPRLGQLPPSVTHVTIALTTLLGIDDDLGQVRGIGAVTAAHARELATTAGSLWRRLVIDPLTARAVTLDPRRYRPPASVAEDIRVRDGLCRGVGCTLGAWRCDLDHVIPWQSGGLTEPANLTPLHRHHHQRKTSGRWRSQMEPDGTLVWTSPLGRTYLTDPATYAEPQNGPFENGPPQNELPTPARGGPEPPGNIGPPPEPEPPPPF